MLPYAGLLSSKRIHIPNDIQRIKIDLKLLLLRRTHSSVLTLTKHVNIVLPLTKLTGFPLH